MFIYFLMFISIIIGTFMAHVTTPRDQWPDYIGYAQRVHGNLVKSDKPKLKLNTRGRLDYYIIANLERDLFGELFHHEGSPRNNNYCGCEICNPSPKCVNGQLCTRPGTHTIREHLPEWNRRVPKGKMPRTPDRTVYVSKRERYIRIVPKGPSYVSLMRAAMGMEYGYGSQCHHRDGETCWHDGYGE